MPTWCCTTPWWTQTCCDCVRRRRTSSMLASAADETSTTQEEITALLVDEASSGNSVVRLKGGDPFVFGRGGEEVAALAKAGVPVRVIPGVSSVLAAPAARGYR